MGAHIGLAVHVQEGYGSPGGWFNNPKSQVSSHFWVGQGGALEQYVDTDREAWAQMNGNRTYLSVETEGTTSQPLTTAQEHTLAYLFRWCHVTYQIPLLMVDHGHPGITTHAHWPSGVPDPAWGGHPCPGSVRAAQLPAIIEQAGPTAPAEGDEDLPYLIHAKDPSGADYNAVCDGVNGHRVHELASLQALEAKLGAPVELTWGDYQTYAGAQ